MAARLGLPGLQHCCAERGNCLGRSRFGSDQASVAITAGRRECLRSQSDVVGEPTRAEQTSFWDRLHKAWRVLVGIPTEAQATKQRFGKVLVRDRGFNSVNLLRLYNTAKGALKQHVELENDGDSQLTAFVDRLGELRLDFRVKRVKSILLDEPYSDPLTLESDSDKRRHWEDQMLVVREVDKSPESDMD